MTVWATLSATVGTPKILVHELCGFGISTARTGGGKYDPELIRFQILYRLFFRSDSNSPKVTSSTPGAPLFAATFLYASHTACLGMSYGLTTPSFGMFPLFLPERTLVDRFHSPDEPVPWLHPHPSEQDLHSYYEPVRQRTPQLVLNAYGFCLGTLPLATRGPNFGPFMLAVGIDARLPMFPARAADQAHAASTPDATWPVKTGNRQAHPRSETKTPSFDVTWFNSASTTTPEDTSPDALERLLGPHLIRSCRTFPLTLATTVFSQRSTGWFDARPRKADAEEPTILHLSQSTASEVVSYMTPPSALMAHYPQTSYCPTRRKSVCVAEGRSLLPMGYMSI